MYVCNCNGIRERDVAAAAQDGASHPALVFKRQGCQAKCGRCIEDMRLFLTNEVNKARLAAE